MPFPPHEQGRTHAPQPPVGRVVVIARMPVLLDGEARNRHRAGQHLQPAGLGQHNAEVATALSHSAEEIATLQAKGVWISR